MGTLRYIALFLFAELCICHCAGAVSPDVKIPKWQRTSIAVSNWSPTNRSLSISVVVEAVGVDLFDVSAEIHAPQDFGEVSDKQTKNLIKKGESSSFVFELKPNIDASGWLTVDLRAKPNRQELLSIANAQDKSQLTKAIVAEQIQNINKPIQIGRSVAITVRKDIAVACTDDLLFSPGLKNKSGEYYLWYPPSNLASGITREALKVFNEGLVAANARKTESAGKMLVSKLEKDRQPLILKKDNEETLNMPYKTAIELIKADVAVVKAVVLNVPEPLETYLQSGPTDFTKPFALYDLALLQNNLNKRPVAQQNLEDALKIIPSWPKAKALLKRLK